MGRANSCVSGDLEVCTTIATNGNAPLLSALLARRKTMEVEIPIRRGLRAAGDSTVVACVMVFRWHLSRSSKEPGHNHTTYFHSVPSTGRSFSALWAAVQCAIFLSGCYGSQSMQNSSTDGRRNRPTYLIFLPVFFAIMPFSSKVGKSAQVPALRMDAISFAFRHHR